MISYGINISNYEAVIKWLDKIRAGSGDARPLWAAMIKSKTIEKFVQHEFHSTQDSHKMWPALSPGYLEWKRKRGETGIGYLSGALREAASSQAKRKPGKKSLRWILDQTVPVSDKGYRYAPVFHWGKKDGSQPARRIFRYTALRVSSFLKLDAKKFESGVTHASFTWRWLKGVLETK